MMKELGLLIVCMVLAVGYAVSQTPTPPPSYPFQSTSTVPSIGYFYELDGTKKTCIYWYVNRGTRLNPVWRGHGYCGALPTTLTSEQKADIRILFTGTKAQKDMLWLKYMAPNFRPLTPIERAGLNHLAQDNWDKWIK